MGDRRICQTFAASPAEPGGLPLMLDYSKLGEPHLLGRGQKAPSAQRCGSGLAVCGACAAKCRDACAWRSNARVTILPRRQESPHRGPAGARLCRGMQSACLSAFRPILGPKECGPVAPSDRAPDLHARLGARGRCCRGRRSGRPGRRRRLAGIAPSASLGRPLVSPGIAGYKVPGDPFYRTARQRTAPNQIFFLFESSFCCVGI
jgi:hypothetical protein